MTAISADEATELTYLTGITADGNVAATSFWTWNDDTPPTYGNNQYEAKWGAATAGTGATITYVFDPASHWTTGEKNAFRATMALWSDVANVQFVESPGASADSSVVISRATDGSASGGITDLYTGTTGTTDLGQAVAGEIAIDTSTAGFGPLGSSFSDYGGYPWTTLIHELGHVLGLGHAGAYNDGTTTVSNPLTSYDSLQYSVMSYIDPTGVDWGSSPGDNGHYYGNDPTTWMPLDILAAQRIYGAATNSPLSGGGQVFGFNTNITGTTAKFFDFTINTQPIVTLWDGGIGNTLDLSGFSAPSTVDLTDGSFSSAAGLTQNIAIAYGTHIDTAITGSGADTIHANDDGDVLTGGAGADTLTGGAGADVFRDTLGDMAGDSIASFGANDRIEVTNASIGSFSVERDSAGLLLGGTSQVDIGAGHYSMTAAASGGVDIFLSAHDPALQDFSADGHSDILWRDTAGTVTIWNLQTNLDTGREQPNAYVFAGVDNGWTLQGTLDWNGDGNADLLWRNGDGAFTIWTGNGADGFAQNAITETGVAPGWTIAAIGDFNGDGRDDLMFRQGNTFTIWDSAGTAGGGNDQNGFDQNVYVNSTVGTDWQVQAAGDFNGDGKTDIFWRNENSGQFTIWSSNGNGFAENTYVDNTVGLDWHLQGVGDFDGDGKTDLFWRNDNGTFTIWHATGTGFTQNVYVDSSVGTDWHLAQIGDFNGDGKSDLLWRNDSGAFSIWDSTGTGFTHNVVLDYSVSTDWTIQTHHDAIV